MLELSHQLSVRSLCLSCAKKTDCGCTFLFFRVALDRAAVLLTMKREMVRLDNVWGVGGGLRPVKHLTKEVSIELTLQNFKNGGDTFIINK